jgi:hypothetical protein
MKTLFFTFGILALICCATPGFAGSVSICDGVTGNLVQNCGFESGNFSSWTVIADDGNTNVERNNFQEGVNSGVFYAALGDETTTPTTIEQTFGDVAGSTITFSFYLYSDGQANNFTADWDGVSVLSLPDAARQAYTLYSFTETGTGSDTISFSIQKAVGFDGLDDVVVVDPSSTPEPSSLAFAAIALSFIAFARRRIVNKKS